MIIRTRRKSTHESVARGVLPASAPKQGVSDLVSAIRAANPCADLDAIQPGMAIVVPTTPTRSA
jgi:hypothetical protein